MNALSTPTTAIKTLLFSVITIAFFGTAALADQVGISTLTKSVRFDGLDLSTTKGQLDAQKRVHQMARTLCSKVADPTDMSHSYNYVACVDAAVAKASLSLQALINQQSPAKFAQVDVK